MKCFEKIAFKTDISHLQLSATHLGIYFTYNACFWSTKFTGKHISAILKIKMLAVQRLEPRTQSVSHLDTIDCKAWFQNKALCMYIVKFNRKEAWNRFLKWVRITKKNRELKEKHNCKAFLLKENWNILFAIIIKWVIRTIMG